MLDQMSGGRFQLGVGRGVSMYETAAYGLDFGKTQAMYHEAFQVLLKGLALGRTDLSRRVLPLRQGADDPEAGADARIRRCGTASRCPAMPPGRRRTTSTSSRSACATTPARSSRPIARRARSSGFDPDGTLIGVSRHIVVADTDEAALAIARRAYPRWRDKLPLAVRPPRHRAARHRHLSADLRRTDRAQQRLRRLARDTVRRFVEAEIEANNCNYFVPQMVFGDMTRAEALRSIELFAQGDHAGVRGLVTGAVRS